MVATDPSERPERNGARTIGVQAVHACIPISTGSAALRSLKTSEMVARQVVHDIVAGELRQHDRLPSESQMLEEYQVSRESLREGLRLLEVQGLITIRRGPGGGPLVGTVDPANLGRASTLYFHLAGATYAELFEAWILAETLLARRAASRPDRDRARAAMEPYVVAPEHLGDAELAEYVDAAAGFHSVVAALGDNRVLELLLPAIAQIVTHHVVVGDDPRQVAHIVGPDHAEIAQAIRAGHAAKAGRLMEEHIQVIADFYAARMGSRMDDYIDWR